MKIDWHSRETDVLLNPRIPPGDQKRYRKELLKDGGLDGHLWFATSGTSGRFKFVALSKEALLVSARAVNRHLNSSKSDIWIKTLPTFHVGGVGIYARSHASGARVVEMDGWDPYRFQSIAAIHQATLTSMVPTQVYDIVNAGLTPCRSLRAVIVGGGVLERPIYDKAVSLGWSILPSYGLTECASQVATADPGAYSVYRILDHVELEVTQEGFISLRSPSLLSLYATLEGEKLTFHDPKVDGIFLTDDKGVIENGSLRVFGRSSAFLKILGESVNLIALQETMDRLRSEMGITQTCLLYPIKEERKGDAVALCVEGEITSNIDRLIEKYQATCLPYEKITHVTSKKQIPRTELGKAIF